MFTVRTDADDTDGGLQLLLKEADVVLEGLGELVLTGETGHVLLPAGQLLIDRFDALLDVIGEVADELTVLLVGHAGLDGVEAVEDVALHHDELRHTVDHDGIAQGYQVYPATAALTAGDSPVLMTEVADLLARLVKELRGEGTGTHTGAVGLHDTVDIANLVRTDAQTGAGTGTDGVGRGDKGIGSEVDIEHRALGTLAEHRLSAAQDAVDLVLGVDDGELAQVLDALKPFLLDLSDVVLETE